MIAIVTLILELILTNIVHRISGMSMGTIEAVLLISVFSISYFVFLKATQKYSGSRGHFAMAYIVRLFYLFFDVFAKSIYLLPNSGGDTETFYRNAIYYAQGRPYWEGATVETFGILVKLFGESRLCIQFLLMMTSIVTIHTVFAALNDELKIERRSTNVAMLVIAIIPNYAILSSLFLRESLIAMFISISVLLFTKWWNGKGELFFFLSFFFVFLGALYHSGVVGVAAGYIMIRLLYDRKAQKFRLTLGSIISAAFFLLIFVFLFNNYASILFGKMQSIESIEDISGGRGRGGSSYAAIAGNSSSLSNFIIYSPVRILLFLFTPLPFQIRGISDIIAMVFSAWFYLWVFWRVFRYIRNPDNRYRRLAIALLIIGIATAFVFGWGCTNVGTSVRHRDKAIALYAVLLGITYEDQRLNKIRVRNWGEITNNIEPER